MKISSNKPICLIGDVYDPRDNQCVLKSVLINDGIITKMIDGKADPVLIEGYFILELADNEIMFPSLINLHTHIGYNVLPLWKSPNIWRSRHQWRKCKPYKKEIREFVGFISEKWSKNIALVNHFVSKFLPEGTFNKVLEASNTQYFDLYTIRAITEVEKIHAILSEMQAVSGGTGLILQTLDLDDEEPHMRHFLIRNTGNSAELGLDEANKIFDVVDFYAPEGELDGDPDVDTSIWKPKPNPKLKEYISSVELGGKPYFSTIAHIGEGTTGNLNGYQKDPYSRLECQTLFKELKKFDPTKLAKSNLVLVHANGVDYDDPETIAFIRDNNISIVWSPVSNLLLYNDTLPIEKLLAAGINVCLGTDWTPSGSKHILDEMKFVKQYCRKQRIDISDTDIFKMASMNPAKALGSLKLSCIVEDSFADLFVFKADKNNPLESLLSREDNNMRFSMINGRIIYGDLGIFEKLAVDYQKLPDAEGPFSKQKAISINSNLNFNLSDALAKMDLLMDAYAKDKLGGKTVKRTKFLSSDDKVYKDRIAKLLADLP